MSMSVDGATCEDDGFVNCANFDLVGTRACDTVEEAIEVMKEYGINLENHRATNIKNSDIEQMDIILCATTAHKNNVINMYPNLEEKIFTMKEYARISKK